MGSAFPDQKKSVNRFYCLDKSFGNTYCFFYEHILIIFTLSNQGGKK